MQNNNLYLIHYLKKQNISENTIEFIHKSRIYKEYLNNKLSSEIVVQIAIYLESEFSFPLKKVRKLIQFFRKHNYLALLIYKNQLLTRDLLIFDKEKKIYYNPDTHQYYLNFFLDRSSKKIHNTYNVKDIYKIILVYNNKKDYQKVFEFCNIFIRISNYTNLLNRVELYNFYEIFSLSCMHLYSGRKLLNVFINIYRKTKEPYFFKQMGNTLFLNKHYHFARKYLLMYFKFLRHNKNKIPIIEEDIAKVKLLLKIIKYLININNKKLILINRSRGINVGVRKE